MYGLTGYLLWTRFEKIRNCNKRWHLVVAYLFYYRTGEANVLPHSNCSTVNLDLCVMNSTTTVDFFYLKQLKAPYNLSRRTTKMNTTLGLAICELKTNVYFTGISNIAGLLRTESPQIWEYCLKIPLTTFQRIQGFSTKENFSTSL
jgi:hypothetical protein